MNIKSRYLVLLLIFLVLAIYYPALFAEINSVDDDGMMQGLFNISNVNIKDVFLPGGSGYYYRPLLVLTFLIDKYVWGLQESFMHLENVLLHTVNTVLVFFIALRIFKFFEVEEKTLSFMAALLFALHPINTESVNWISGRTDLLAAVFVLSSLLVLLTALDKRRTLLAFPATLLFFAGCLSKDTAIFTLPALLLVIYCFDKKTVSQPPYFITNIQARLGYYLSYLIAVIGYFVMRHLAFNRGDSGIALASKGVIGPDLELFHKVRIFLKAFGFYVKKLIVPWPLNFAIVNISNYYVVLGLLAIIVCCYFIYKPSLLHVLFLFSACIISPAFLVPLGRMAWTPYAERYLYISSTTFCIAITFIASQIWRKYWHGKYISRCSIVLLFVFFTGMAYATVDRNIIWQSNLTLYEDTVNKSPDFVPIKNELALALQRHGRNEEAKKIFLANNLPVTEKYHIIADINRANAMAANGDAEEAKIFLSSKPCDEANSFYKKYLETILGLNNKILQETDDPKKIKVLKNEAMDILKKLQVYTNDPYYYYRMGQLYMFDKKNKEAKYYFRLAYEKSPDDAFYKLAAKKLAEKLRQ